MKNNQPVTDNERYMKQGSILVSKTDLKGTITYCNKDFVAISGFEYRELLGKNHNIVRHPDMPAEAFDDLWSTVKSGKPWTGIVKNRCKNGDYYWVKANVTPLTHNGRITEYMSVRTMPSREEIADAEKIYQQINAKKITLKQTGIKKLLAGFKSIDVKLLLGATVFVTVAVFAVIAAMIVMKVPNVYILGTLGMMSFATLLFGLLLTRYVTKPMEYVREKLGQMAEGNYFDWIETDRNDEIGRMIQSLKMTQIKLGFDVMDAREKANEAARIQQALENVSTAVTVSDNANVLIYMNKAAHKHFDVLAAEIKTTNPGFKVDDLIGTSLADFFPDDQLRDMYQKKLTETTESRFEAWSRTMKLITSPVFDTDDEYQGRVTQWFDITEELAVEQEIDQIVEAARSGDLTKRIELEGKEGFFHQLGSGINALIAVVENGLNDIAIAMGNMAKGDLTKPITNEYEGTFDQVKRDVNMTMANLEKIIAELRDAGDVIATAADEISAGNNNLSARTEQQASALEETASSMEELTSTVKNNADNAQQANQLAAVARQTAEKGGAVVSEAVQAMDEINASSNKIAEIIGVIDEIAFQTNLLALNASVEAARAGEQGRGFAVVATEVRNLAGRSATAAKEIKELIQDSAVKVKTGAELVNESGETLDEIVNGVKKVGDIISEIAAASQEQSAGIDQVNQAVTSMDEVTQQNAALAEETSAASASMNEKAREMDQLISFFTISSTTVANNRQKRNAHESFQARPVKQPTYKSPTRTAKSTVTNNHLATAVAHAPLDDADGDEWEEF